MSDRLTFQIGDALHLPFEDGAFDAVFLQHVAMNFADRSSLYAEMRRILAPGGCFATYDLVLRVGDVVYPALWARDASASFLLNEGAVPRSNLRPVAAQCRHPHLQQSWPELSALSRRPSFGKKGRSVPPFSTKRNLRLFQASN